MKLARLALALLASACIVHLQGARLYTAPQLAHGLRGASGVSFERPANAVVPLGPHGAHVYGGEFDHGHIRAGEPVAQQGSVDPGFMTIGFVAALAVTGTVPSATLLNYMRSRKKNARAVELEPAQMPELMTAEERRRAAFKKKQESEIPMGEVVVPNVRNADPASDSIRSYLINISQYPLLSRVEESDLAQAMEARDQAKAALGDELEDETRIELERVIGRGDEAERTFYMCNLRLVVWTAKKYKVPKNMSFMDLVQNGNLGLLRAIEKWDWRKGIRFSSYGVWWIRQAVSRSLGEGQTIRHPEHIRLAIMRMKSAQRDFVQENGRPPRQEELAAVLGQTEAQVVNLLRVQRPSVSLDTPLKMGKSSSMMNRTLLDTVDSTSKLNPLDFVAQSQVSEQVAATVEKLQPREAYVLTCRFGLDGKGTRSLQVIGDRLGVTRERVRQIQKAALNRLRLFHTAELQEHMNQYLEVENVVDTLEGQVQKRFHR